MNGKIIAQVGFVYISAAGLMRLAILTAFAACCFLLAKRQGIKPRRVAKTLACGFAGMWLLGRLFYLLFDKSARLAPFAGGEMGFAALLGWFGAIRLTDRSSPKALRRVTNALGPALCALTAALYLFCGQSAGRVSEAGGLLTRKDVYELARWNVSLLQGIALCVLMLAAFLLSKTLKDRFRIGLAPISLMGLSLILPFEALRDCTQMRILGVHIEALFMLLTLLIAEAIHFGRRLRDSDLPLSLQRAVLGALMLIQLLGLIPLRAGSALAAFALISVPCLLSLSPLFPFIKRPQRASGRERARRFN